MPRSPRRPSSTSSIRARRGSAATPSPSGGAPAPRGRPRSPAPGPPRPASPSTRSAAPATTTMPERRPVDDHRPGAVSVLGARCSRRYGRLRARPGPRPRDRHRRARASRSPRRSRPSGRTTRGARRRRPAARDRSCPAAGRRAPASTSRTRRSPPCCAAIAERGAARLLHGRASRTRSARRCEAAGGPLRAPRPRRRGAGPTWVEPLTGGSAASTSTSCRRPARGSSLLQALGLYERVVTADAPPPTGARRRRGAQARVRGRARLRRRPRVTSPCRPAALLADAYLDRRGGRAIDPARAATAVRGHGPATRCSSRSPTPTAARAR